MDEPKPEGGASETLDMDAHLDAAIRELDRIRRVGDGPVAQMRPDRAASIQGGDTDLDSELFEEVPAAVASAVPLIAPEAAPAMGPEPLAATVDVDATPAGDTIAAEMTPTAADMPKSETHEVTTHVADPAVDAPAIADAAASREFAPVAPIVAEPLPVALEPPAAPLLRTEPRIAEANETSPLPQRMFGLRRALEAHRQTPPPTDFPERIEPRLEPVAPKAVAPKAVALKTAEPKPTEPAVEPEAAEPEPVASAAIIPIAAAASVAAVAASTAPDVAPPEPAPKADRRGWFGFRRAREPEPAVEPTANPEQVIAAPPEPVAAPVSVAAQQPEAVDLTPVREAMAAAAARRAQELEVAPAHAEAASATSTTTTSPMPQPSPAGRVGVLLINLGTPEAPTARAVRNYLREFLADKRVIEKDSFLWQLVLRGVILPWRPRFKARAYRSIWNRANDESPLKTVTRAQATKLGEALANLDGSAVVDWAMRYGHPAIEERLRAMMAQGCGRILIVPLYPQYSSATTATACDEVFRVLSRIRNQPAVRFAPAYYADPVYIEAVASSIKAELATLSFVPEAVVASFHGMPLDYVQKGDPYYNQCVATARLVRERLGMNEQNFILTFQSRFGRAEWLQPYTIETLRKLAKDGVKNVAVVTPGFSADCLETLEEIAVENAHAFKKKGGKNFAFVPCLNDSERGMAVIWDIATRELKGWV